MAGFDRYMAQYDHEHHNPWNKVFHAIGIPAILAGIVLLILLHWKIGLALFLGGWILLFAGHRIEGNKPAFFQGVIYFLAGQSGSRRNLKRRFSGAATVRLPRIEPEPSAKMAQYRGVRF